MSNPSPSPAPSPFPQERLRWVLCWLLFVATALSFLDRQVLSILSPTILSEFHMDSKDYSYVVSAFQLSYTIMFTLGGRFVDRVGTGLGLGVAVAVWSLASGAHALVMGCTGLAVARFFLGFGEGACFPGATKGAVEWFPADKRVLAIGIANGGSAFGAVLAPPLTAVLASFLGWRGVFIGTAVVGLAWVAVWLWTVRKLQPSAPAPSSSLPEAPAAPVQRTSIRTLLGQRRVWSILCSRFIFDPVVYFLMFWVPQYLARERNMSVTEIGNWFWIPFLALGIGNVFSGKLTESLIHSGWTATRSRSVIMISAAVVSTLSWVVPLASSQGVAIGLMTCVLFAHGFWITNFLGLIGDNFAKNEVATVTGLSGTAGGTAAIISSLVIGRIVDSFSYLPVFVAMGLLYPLSIFILLRTRWRAGDHANA